jgi:hypothetical protein
MSQTRKVRNNPKCYGLDNAARIYPSVRSSDWGAVFRLACHLDADIDPERLGTALADTLARLPLFAVSLRRGFFWYYHEKLDGIPFPEPERAWPCILVDAQNNEGFLFRVGYWRNRIAVEFFHSLTDATGALVFLKTLAARYLSLGGVDIPAEEGVLDCGPPADPAARAAEAAAQAEDAFARYAGPSTGGSFAESPAWSLPFSPEALPILHVTHGIVNSIELSAIATSLGGTITGLLSGILMLAFDSVSRDEDGIPDIPIRISIPFNLRRIHETGSLRNFSLFTNAALPLRDEPPSLEAAVAASMEAMRVGHSPEALDRMMALNVATAGNPLLAFLPLFFKNAALKIAFALVGQNQFTTSLSNLGLVRVPQAMADHVSRFDFVLGRPRGAGVNCGVVGFEGRLVISLSSSVRGSDIEREFFRRLASLGAAITIDSNRGG